jgi:hypothetical protein
MSSVFTPEGQTGSISAPNLPLIVAPGQLPSETYVEPAHPLAGASHSKVKSMAVKPGLSALKMFAD